MLIAYLLSEARGFEGIMPAIWEQMESCIKKLSTIDGIKSAFVFAKNGDIVASSGKVSMDKEAISLIETAKTLIPIIVNLPKTKTKRVLYQFSYGGILFSDIAEQAFLGCFLSKDFHFVHVLIETDKVSYIIENQILNKKVDEKNMLKREEELRKQLQEIEYKFHSSTLVIHWIS
ncbi:hypothetical protein CW714_03585 [Methanophagales archaeon]|nr:MAG: hypothetical protein CW714_03585 [Methanophagales archaeon]